MKTLFLSRLFWRLAPAKATQALRSTALAEWEACFERGAAPDASDLDRNFHRVIAERTERIVQKGEQAQRAQSLEDLRVYAWAAHYAPVEVFAALQVMTAQTFARSQDFGDSVRCGLSLELERDVSGLRTFPQLSNAPTKRKPHLETVETRQAEEAWRQSLPLVTFQSPPEEIAGVFADFSADDLHALAHGEDMSDAPLAEAIARHPNCDWGSACEILHSYSAVEYQSYWVEGRSEDTFSDDERRLFRAFATISDRAKRGDFATRRFAHNWRLGDPVRPDGTPNPNHPSNWLKWRITLDQIEPTLNEAPRPNVLLDGGNVRLTFEAWTKAQR